RGPAENDVEALLPLDQLRDQLAVPSHGKTMADLMDTDTPPRALRTIQGQLQRRRACERKDACPVHARELFEDLLRLQSKNLQPVQVGTEDLEHSFSWDGGEGVCE